MAAPEKALTLAPRAVHAPVKYEPPDIFQTGQMLAKSGYFQDARDAAQSFVKILAGRELGIGDIAAMTGIYIVKGRVTLSANLMAALVKRSGRYNYRVLKMDDTACEIEFYEDGQPCGKSAFTANDARAAGLGGDNWKKFPKNMLFARAMSNGVKWYCPDVSMAPIYTPDELGAQVDGESGEVIEARAEPHAAQGESFQHEPARALPAATPERAQPSPESDKEREQRQKRAAGLVARGLVRREGEAFQVSDGAIKNPRTYDVGRDERGKVYCSCDEFKAAYSGFRCEHILAAVQFTLNQQQPEPTEEEKQSAAKLRERIYREFAHMKYSAEDIAQYMQKNAELHGGTVLEVMSLEQLGMVASGLEIK